MFREMRRKRQELSRERAEEILKGRKLGVLGVNGDGGYPYTVPVNYTYQNGKIYFHGAKAGHKYDAMLRDDRVSLAVIDRDEIDAERLTTLYSSVIVFGRVRIIEDEAELIKLGMSFGLQFLNDPEKVESEVKLELPALSMFEITPEHITAKAAKELIRAEAEK